MKKSAWLAPLAAFSVAGCIQLTVDESSVFAPQEPLYRAETQEALRLNQQDRLLPATIEHGYLPYGEGLRLAWTRVSREGEDRPLVVHCGGNASDRYRNGAYYAFKVIDRADVLLFDYPGYGDSSGQATTADFEAAREALSNFAAAQAGEQDLVFWGHSLGGFVCAALAEETPGTDGMVFEASARNAEEVAASWKPWYLPFVRINIAPGLGAYDNAEALSGFEGPVLVMAAGRDDTLKPRLSRKLVEALEAEGLRPEFVIFKKAGHTNIPNAEGFDALVDAYFERLKSR